MLGFLHKHSFALLVVVLVVIGLLVQDSGRQADTEAPGPPRPTRPAEAVLPPAVQERERDAAGVKEEAGDDWLDVVGRVPLPGEALVDQVTVFFDAPIAVPEGEDAPLMRVDAALRGDIRVGGNYLSLWLAEALPPSEQVFTVTLNPALRSAQGKLLNPAHRRFAVTAFTFEPKSVFTVEDSPDRTVLGVLFPVAVQPEAVCAHVEARGSNGAAVSVDVVEGTGPKCVHLVLGADSAWPVSLTFQKGLPDAGGDVFTQRAMNYLYPSEPFFRVASCAWGFHDAEKAELALRFSKAVYRSDLRAHLAVSDAKAARPVPYEFGPGEGRSEEHVLVFRMAVVKDAALDLAIGAALPGAERRVLGKAYRAAIPWERPALEVTSITFDEPGQGAQRLTFRFSKAVDATELARCLIVRRPHSHEAIPFTVTTDGQKTRHNVLLEVEERLLEVDVSLAEGLAGAGMSALKQAWNQRVRHRLREHEGVGLRVVRTSWDRWRARRDKEGMALRVRLNAPVVLQSLEEHLAFEPELPNMRVELGSYNNFYVYGEWNSKQEYAMRLTPGLRYKPKPDEEKTLEEPVVYHVKTEDVPPYLGIGCEGKWYLPRRQGAAWVTPRSGGSLPIESRNLRNVTITLDRMFASNIAVALADMNDGRAGGGFSSTWCETITRTEMDLAYRPDRLVETPLDLDSLFPPDKKGVFALSLRGDQGGSASKLLLWTDIGLLAHWRNEELVVFAHNLFSLAPIPMAKVCAYSTKNQLLGSGNTDEQGIAHLGPFDVTLGTPRVVVVEHGDDYTFLELERRGEGGQAVGQGLPGYDREGYDAFLYADRDLYRPGETVHARWLVRTRYGDPVSGVPLLVKVIKPNRRQLLSETAVLSSLGTGELDIVTEKGHPTGRYTVQLCVPGNARSVGSYTFSLEEFVPNRIKAAVEVAGLYWVAGRDYKVRVDAQHLFGAPAAGRKCEVGVVLRRGAWATEQWRSYRFSNDSPYKPGTAPCGEARTDENGTALFDFNYAATSDVSFPLEATVIGHVFELGGRPVTDKAALMLFPSEICLGVAVAHDEETNEIEVFAAAVKPDETPADLGEVKVTLEKRVWSYYVRRYHSHYGSHWSESYEHVTTRDVPLQGGKGSTRFGLDRYGHYRVRVHSEATPQYSTRSFYSYGSWYRATDDTRPSLIELTLDKDVYQVGDLAEVRIESPFDGKAVVVVQGEEIQRVIPVDIRDGVGFVRLQVGQEQCPNVWVEATVIHAVQEERTQVYPFSSFAMANLEVRDPARRLQVGFPFLPQEVRPAGQATFAVETLDHTGQPVSAEVTVAAVDEGIHAITDYRTPDPFAWLFRPRRPDLRRAHYYDKVAYDFDKPAIGGDGVEGLMGKRLPTVGENWIRPVALWSGVVRTGDDGLANVTFDVPEFSGQLRLVAVACNETALGSRGEHVFVRRPYMLRTSMPRFLLPGDSTRCRATVFNHSDAACTATVRWSTTGVLDECTDSKELAVAPHGEASLLADFAALGSGVGNAARQATGQGTIHWEVVVRDGAGREVERLTEVAPIPVRAPGAFQSRHELAVLKPGETRTFRNEHFLDNQLTELELVVGANPVLRLKDALEHVVRYPYGCVEQTTSRLLPMYLLRRVAALAELPLYEQDCVEAYLQAGIDRLFLMQTYGGGLACWPDGRGPYPYGSVYALHFLTLVKNDREFDLPDENFKALQRYVRRILKDWTSSSYSELFKRAYALYVLALGGDLEAIQQIERFDSIKMPRAARFLLAGALAHSTHDLDRVKDYLASTPSEPYAVRELDGTLNSDVRNKAIELLVLRQIGGDATQMAEKANELLEWIEEHRRGVTHAAPRYGSTQETAFIVSALGTYLTDLADGVLEASATVAGPQEKHALGGLETYRAEHCGAGGAFTVANTGKANLYVDLTTRGVPKTIDTEPVSEGGLAVARRFHTPLGALCTEAEYAQGDSYVVDIAITVSKKLENVIVADVFPAGFEIENPRLEPDALPAGRFHSTVRPTFLEVRDDRLVLAFDRISNNGRPKETHHFYYLLRAVTPGRYSHPAIQAECMYDPSIRSVGRPRVIEVK